MKTYEEMMNEYKGIVTVCPTKYGSKQDTVRPKGNSKVTHYHKRVNKPTKIGKCIENTSMCYYK